MSKSIGVAIPCYDGHIELLKVLLDSINEQTKMPNIVVVSCSSTKQLILDKSYNFDLKIITTEKLQNAAENRNIASTYINTDIITFIDADDSMHPQRTEIILNIFEQNNIDILYHNAFLNNDIFKPYETIEDPDVVYDELIQGHGCITHSNINRGLICHGPVTVLKSIYDQVKFSENYGHNLCDDCVFGYNVFNIPNIKTAYVSNPLIKYIPSHTMETFNEMYNKC